jgi:hypothetical protein
LAAPVVHYPSQFSLSIPLLYLFIFSSIQNRPTTGTLLLCRSSFKQPAAAVTRAATQAPSTELLARCLDVQQ